MDPKSQSKYELVKFLTFYLISSIAIVVPFEKNNVKMSLNSIFVDSLSEKFVKLIKGNTYNTVRMHWHARRQYTYEV